MTKGHYSVCHLCSPAYGSELVMIADIQCGIGFSVIPKFQKYLNRCKRESAVDSFQKMMHSRKDYVSINFDKVLVGNQVLFGSG